MTGRDLTFLAVRQGLSSGDLALDMLASADLLDYLSATDGVAVAGKFPLRRREDGLGGSGPREVLAEGPEGGATGDLAVLRSRPTKRLKLGRSSNWNPSCSSLRL